MKKAILFILVLALMVFCFSSCDIDKVLGSKVDIDEAMPHYGNTAPPSPTVKKVDPDEAMPHYKMQQKR